VTKRSARQPKAFAELRDGTEIGAWLFKANPDVWDILGFLRGGAAIDQWRMAPSYRVDLVGPGQPAVLWVTGPTSGAHIPGVWAMGAITGEVGEDVGDPDDDLWRDHGAQRQVRPYVNMHLEPLAEPIARVDLAADPRFVEAEILRRPRMGNPVALRPVEYETILDHAG
jgi:hypothetical protein